MAWRCTNRKKTPRTSLMRSRQARISSCRRCRKAIRCAPVYERTDIVDKPSRPLGNAPIEGSILVAIVLFLFLGELRAALVVIIALPLAMLIAFILMGEAGLSANLMSLAGLAIGIGMMVDGAVVMVENAFRIMAERKELGESVDRTSAVLAAAREVANPIAFAIMIIVVGFCRCSPLRVSKASCSSQWHSRSVTPWRARCCLP